MKCVLCEARKGKRSCPAKQARICAQCCGEKRILEIDCPETCEYLKAGRDREVEHEYARHLRPADSIQQEQWMRVLGNFKPVMAGLETTIAEERLASRHLTDEDVAEALDCLLKTLRTEDNGVIYETASANLRAEALRRSLRDMLHVYRNPQEQSKPRLLLKDAIDCLELLRAIVKSHLEAGSAELSFVDFLVRRLPKTPGIAGPESSIIVPGR